MLLQRHEIASRVRLAAALAPLALACACSQAPAPTSGETDPSDSQPATTAPTVDAPASAAAPNPAGLPSPAEPVAIAPETVVAVVDGAEVKQADVLQRFDEVLLAQYGARPIPEFQRDQLRSQMSGQILEELVNERLLDAAATKAAITLAEADYAAEFRRQIDSFLITQSLTEAEFAERLQELEGTTIDEFVTERMKDANFRRGILHARLLEVENPEDFALTDEALKERYDSELESQWTLPTLVRASHILFKVPESPEEAEQARTKAGEVRDLARAEGADFAALAREHSEGPSGPEGGDLGFFPRTGAMVEPFAAAAFALAEGETSDLVETDFGLHVIQVTGRKEGRVIPFEEALPSLRQQLRTEVVLQLRIEKVQELRKEAEITYPKG